MVKGSDFVYSTFAAEVLAELVRREYHLPHPVNCQLLRRGFNDHYLIRSGDDEYILRLYLHGKYYLTGESDILFELELLDHLKQRDIPVAYPLPRTNGALFGTLSAPEGARYYALFIYAPGKPAAPLSEAHRAILGRQIARFHLAADTFAASHQRYHLDLDILINKPLARMQPYIAPYNADAWDFLVHWVDEITENLRPLQESGTGYGIIHGDMHSGNCHFTDDRQVTFFDFDHCGYGWRAYDVAVCTGSSSAANRTAFLEGYEDVRPLDQVERAALPWLVQARALWDDGDILGMAHMWGDAAFRSESRIARLISSYKELREKCLQAIEA